MLALPKWNILIYLHGNGLCCRLCRPFSSNKGPIGTDEMGTLSKATLLTLIVRIPHLRKHRHDWLDQATLYSLNSSIKFHYESLINGILLQVQQEGRVLHTRPFLSYSVRISAEMSKKHLCGLVREKSLLHNFFCLTFDIQLPQLLFQTLSHSLDVWFFHNCTVAKEQRESFLITILKPALIPDKSVLQAYHF